MIPALVADEIRDTLLDYLRTTWALSDHGLEQALFRFLETGNGHAGSALLQGPYVSVKLPFATAPADVEIPLDVRPPYPPHLHQLRAWNRLTSCDRHEPEATLVTTGTGSGKTECFLYPILDHCLRAHGLGGNDPQEARRFDRARVGGSRLQRGIWPGSVLGSISDAVPRKGDGPKLAPSSRQRSRVIDVRSLDSSSHTSAHQVQFCGAGGGHGRAFRAALPSLRQVGVAVPTMPESDSILLKRLRQGGSASVI